jgi:LPS-assembly protein
LNTTLNFKNLTTEFNFIEENGEFGDGNTLENKTKLKFNDDHYLTFNSRRNRKISLTEYYDLIYEYKNDCLVAGIKYNKTYYEDRDLKPSENLLFTITLSPLTSFEQKVDK